MIFRLTYSKLRILMLYLIVYGLLWFGYVVFIVPVFGYSGFDALVKSQN